MPKATPAPALKNKPTRKPARLHAVAVEHLPENCPPEQISPDIARKLAQNLAANPTIGVFSMKLHHGVALVETDNPAELIEVFSQILPNHKPAEVADVQDKVVFQEAYQNPAQLDDEASRLRLLAAAHEVFPHKTFDQTAAQGLPHLPLSSEKGRSLPDYLHEQADAIQSSADAK